MATKKSKARAKQLKPTVSAVVDDVLKRRAQALRARAQVISSLPTPTVAATPAMAAMMTADTAKATTASPKVTSHVALTAAAKGATRGWLIAEGDSWFDYPGTDLLDALEQSAYDIQSVASAGA